MVVPAFTVMWMLLSILCNGQFPPYVFRYGDIRSKKAKFMAPLHKVTTFANMKATYRKVSTHY